MSTSLISFLCIQYNTRVCICQAFFTSFCAAVVGTELQDKLHCAYYLHCPRPLHSIPIVLASLVHIYVYNTIMLTFVCKCVSLCKCITQTVCEQVCTAVQRCVRGRQRLCVCKYRLAQQYTICMQMSVYYTRVCTCVCVCIGLCVPVCVCVQAKYVAQVQPTMCMDVWTRYVQCVLLWETVLCRHGVYAIKKKSKHLVHTQTRRASYVSAPTTHILFVCDYLCVVYKCIST